MKLERPTAMLVVEMQRDLALAHPFRDSPKISSKLADAVERRGCIPKLSAILSACRNKGIAVVYCNKEREPGEPLPDFPAIYRIAGKVEMLVRGTEGAQVVPELAPQPGDTVIARLTSIDPSYGSELWDVLERLGARTLIVAGISTTFAVEGTVRAAANRGYRVVVLEDCCAGVPDAWHDFSVGNVLPLLAEVTTSAELIGALSRP